MISNLGERILTLRKEMNLSQESLAEQIGVSRQAISKWERGEASPDIQNLSALAETFGLTVDEFIHADTDLSKKKSKLVALELKKNAEKLIMIAIAIFILSAFGFILLPFSSKVNILIFGILITAGVLMCIKAGFMFERFYMLNKDYLDQDDEAEFPTQSKLSQKKKNAMGTAVSLICTIIYLFISFVYGLWHPGWLVFLFIPIAYALFDVFETNKGTHKK